MHSSLFTQISSLQFMIYFYLDTSGKQIQRENDRGNFLNPKWAHTSATLCPNASYIDFNFPRFSREKQVQVNLYRWRKCSLNCKLKSSTYWLLVPSIAKLCHYSKLICREGDVSWADEQWGTGKPAWTAAKTAEKSQLAEETFSLTKSTFQWIWVSASGQGIWNSGQTMAIIFFNFFG